MGQQPIPSGGFKDGVLNPNSKPAGEVTAGFDGDNIAGFDRVFGPGINLWFIVNNLAQAVAERVGELDDLPGNRVHLRGVHPATSKVL